ncbi:MAG: 5-(carboxyamino)imidazole ribonucleotide synthase [Verrucomicrobiales bacterium]
MTALFPPGSSLGIVGGGQLGRMLAREARRKGYRVVVFTDEYPPSPAGQLATREINAAYYDPEALSTFVRDVDVVTVEFENIPGPFLAALEQRRPVFPSRHAIEITQNREREKNFLHQHAMPCAEFRIAEDPTSLAVAVAELGTPCVLKTAAFGYDGKGQMKLNDPDADWHATWASFGAARGVVEAWIPFACEVSVVAARGQDGTFVPFSCVENQHTNHILDVTIAPARVAPTVAEEATRLAQAVAEALDYVGVLAVEMFVLPDGRVLVNEIAPRPHNSGHYTIDACVTNQFEQHLRAVTGLPLGDPTQHTPAVMVNLLGDVWPGETESPDWTPILRHPRAKLHLYGKRRALPKRKMGHFTVLGNTSNKALVEALAIKSELMAQKTLSSGIDD